MIDNMPLKRELPVSVLCAWVWAWPIYVRTDIGYVTQSRHSNAMFYVPRDLFIYSSILRRAELTCVCGGWIVVGSF
jgi:hypothetical protein